MMLVLEGICLAGCSGAHGCSTVQEEEECFSHVGCAGAHLSKLKKNEKEEKKRSSLLSDMYPVLVHISARLLKKKKKN